MAQHGGKRAGAGRKPGSVSKAKKDLADMAKGHAETALKTLVQIAEKGDSEAARVSAANAILDRAYGRPFQATVTATVEQAPEAFDGWSIGRLQPDTD